MNLESTDNELPELDFVQSNEIAMERREQFTTSKDQSWEWWYDPVLLVISLKDKRASF